MGQRHFAGICAANGFSLRAWEAWGRPAAGGDHGRASMLAVECARAPSTSAGNSLRRRPGEQLGRGIGFAAGAKKNAKPISIALLANVVDVLEQLLARGIKPDALTDQTSAHDPVNGYLPQGWSVQQWDERRVSDPQATAVAATASMAKHVQCLLRYKDLGLPVFDYATTSGKWRATPAWRAPSTSRLRTGIHSPAVLPGYRPVSLGGLSGDPQDIYKTDAKVKELIPMIHTCISGSTWRANVFNFKDCPRASVGWVWVSATA